MGNPPQGGGGGGGGGSSNLPNWQEDGNSPINGSGAQAHSVSLANTYDAVKVKIQKIQNDQSSSNQVVGVRINGNAGSWDYTTVVEDGTSQTNEGSIRLTGGSDLSDGEFLTGDFRLERGDFGRIALIGPFGTGTPSNTTASGRLNVSSAYPVSSVELRGRSGNITAKAKVFGWNGGI